MAYNEDFLGESNTIQLPELDAEVLSQYQDSELDSMDFYLDYEHYSLLQNPFRKFPIYTVANIDGERFRKVPRKDAWKFDSRIENKYQLGSSFYSSERSDFDKGHMTKREDVQWGESDEEAKSAALSTFYYTNAVPQVDKLNRGIWSKIEKYILHSETVKRQRKIILLTGPVLSKHDPVFISMVGGEEIQIPTLFWKIIYYLNDSEVLHRTAFIVNQSNLLEERGIVKSVVRGIEDEVYEPFMEFKDADVYQTEVKLIEELCQLKFSPAIELFKETRPTRLIVKDTEVRGHGDEEYEEEMESVIIKNITI